MELDIYAPCLLQFPYHLGQLLSKGGEANVYEVKSMEDGCIYAAKKRFNPCTVRELEDDREALLRAYKSFLAEVLVMMNSDH